VLTVKSVADISLRPILSNSYYLTCYDNCVNNTLLGGGRDRPG